MNLGQSPTGQPEYADYAGGSGTSALTFEWVVASTDLDTNGIFFYGPSGTRVLLGGTIRNDGIDAVRATINRGTQGGHKVNGSLIPVTDSAEIASQIVSGVAAVRADVTVTQAPTPVEIAARVVSGNAVVRAAVTVAQPPPAVEIAAHVVSGNAVVRASVAVAQPPPPPVEIAAHIVSGNAAVRSDVTVVQPPHRPSSSPPA